ncbi:hypothetical protein LB941_09970 [Ligilactobacillus sp. WILCCON 0076]|uniref:Uncharacterized protein n=1 Tax=Ligilactobacillus ubinensis TaxID=2876789 RepID=A0A9X2FLC2_9LACO|nr:hypothetical protein [Ligilactobacillus ubinensis]MCP0887657.1 hypothetical protein [Ligilactobacillus ubinensis]
MDKKQFEQEMYTEAYKIARYLKDTKQDLIFFKTIQQRGKDIFKSTAALGLTITGLSIELNLRLVKLVIKYGINIIDIVIDILEGKATGIKLTVESNKK